jgi:tRNA pseudouridine55 synthase
MATGLLILLIGNATRLSEYVLGHDKRYIAHVKLGEQTNTDDVEGEVIARGDVGDISLAQLTAMCKQFSGELEQIPPQFSAIKRNGIRAYALARKGEQVELNPRIVTIHQLEILRITQDKLMLDVTCSSGTYIRALARDIGAALGCGGHLSALRRTHIGNFSVEQAVSVANISPTALLPADAATQHFAAVMLAHEAAISFIHGQSVPVIAPAQSALDDLLRVYEEGAQFIGVGKLANDKTPMVKPVKVLAAQAVA